MTTRQALFACSAALFLASTTLAPPAAAAGSQRAARAIAAAVDAEAPAAVDLLERLATQNSGTFNRAGVEAVGRMLEAELTALGFRTRWVPMDAIGRAPHLVAERDGGRGQRLLLIGHMDTVFEPFHPFRKFTRNGDSATGPGVNDMKGGLVVMLSALKALRAAGALDDARITVFITSDEEAPGEPVEQSRRELVEIAKRSDATLCFESGISRDGKDYVSIGRRGFTGWRVASEGRPGHSGGIFSAQQGDGAAFELSRVLSRFHDELREPNLTYNVGLMLGGANIKLEEAGIGSVAGKTNIVPAEAQAIGDLRALTPAQVERVKQRMREIVAASLPGTSSTITFEGAEYPPMEPAPRNAALLARYNEASVAMGLPPVFTLDPLLRGAGDSAFVSPYVATITGLGAVGQGSHAAGESVDLARLPVQAKRAAMTIYALSR
jgi:glutamate carboxypeptidase